MTGRKPFAPVFNFLLESGGVYVVSRLDFMLREMLVAGVRLSRQDWLNIWALDGF